MANEHQHLTYWVNNELVHNKDFSVGKFSPTPSGMTNMATLAWGDSPRAPDDYGRVMSINSPRFVMFNSPRHPQVNERYFDAQLCFPAEMPKHFPYRDAELKHCEEFIRVLKKFNQAILNYYLDNCDIFNWEALRATMGYKRLSDIPTNKKQEWIRNQPKLCHMLFSINEKDERSCDDGSTEIHGTRWYCIKIKIRAQVPEEKELRPYYFGKKKDSGQKESRKKIDIVVNATPAPSVRIHLNRKIDGTIEQLLVWPPDKKDDDGGRVDTTHTYSSSNLNSLIQKKVMLDKHLVAARQRLGSDIGKLLPNGCTGQTLLVFDHLTQKSENNTPCMPTIRIFGNTYSIIHTPKAVATKVLTLDLDAPDALFDDGSDDFPSLSDPIVADPVVTAAITTTTTTNAASLFNQEVSVGNDDKSSGNKFGFKKRADEGMMSVAEMRKKLAQNKKAAQGDTSD